MYATESLETVVHLPGVYKPFGTCDQHTYILCHSHSAGPFKRMFLLQLQAELLGNFLSFLTKLSPEKAVVFQINSSLQCIRLRWQKATVTCASQTHNSHNIRNYTIINQKIVKDIIKLNYIRNYR